MSIILKDSCFKINKKNNLELLFDKKSYWKKEKNFPGKMELRGRWELDVNHNLVLYLKENKSFLSKKRLIFKGNILETQSNALGFSVHSINNESLQKPTLIKLNGRWFSDRFNRISFEIKKDKDSDILTFRNEWQINKNNRIEYVYEILKTKEKKKIFFDGFWEIFSKKKIKYNLTKSGSEAFNFSVALQTPNLYPAKSKIKYRIGVGFRKERQDKVISLKGNWKIGRDLGLIFESDYAKNNPRSIKFRAKVKVNEVNDLIFTIYNKDGEPLGMSVKFLRKSTSKKHFEYFAKLAKSKTDTSLNLGCTFRF